MVLLRHLFQACLRRELLQSDWFFSLYSKFSLESFNNNMILRLKCAKQMFQIAQKCSVLQEEKNMEIKSSMALLFLSIYLHILLVQARKPLAPAVYIFGDSLSDSGNNNFLRTGVRGNYAPYGIDFPSGPTGRFTNGRTFVDIITQLLGLPFVPPYLGLSEGERSRIDTGVNYASGSAGILPETGNVAGVILSLDEQIDYFESTATTDLPKMFRTTKKIRSYLSKSIFFVAIGVNDYLINYLLPAFNNSSQLYTPEQFAVLLTNGLRIRLTRLYDLGARKFLVMNIPRKGCAPAVVNSASPRPITPCQEDVNNLILGFNSMQPSMITTLESTLAGSTFIQGDFYDMNQTSAEAGFREPQTPCCEVSRFGQCLQHSALCKDRNAFIFWDAFHPAEVAVRDRATDCFSGSVSCVPMNVQQLAKSKMHAAFR